MVHLPVDLTDEELRELCQRTQASSSAEAVALAVREYLRLCRLRELVAKAGQFEYDENAWRELEQAELNAMETHIDPKDRSDA